MDWYSIWFIVHFYLLLVIFFLQTNSWVSLCLYSPVYQLTFTCWKYNNTLQCVVEALWLHCFISPVYAAPSPAGCGPPAWTPQSAAAPGSYHHPARAASCQQDHLCQCVVTAQYTSLPSHTALIAKLVCRWQASYADTGLTHGHHTLQGTVASTWTWQHNRGPAPAAGRRGQQRRVGRLPAARGSRCHCPRCPPPPPPRPRPPRAWGRGRAATRSCGYSPGSRSSRTAVCLCSPGQPCDILIM